MRPIKFRAWDKKRKRMYYDVQDFYDGLGYHEYPTGVAHCFGDFINNPDIELMEFTGLHDKNGKEIWEGDILKVLLKQKVTDETYKTERIAVVKFECGCFRAEYWGGGHQNAEVLGNIYEDRNLLGENS